MAEDAEKNVYVHFVDERDFKEVSVEGKRKSKKNPASGFVLTAVSAESSSEDDEVEDNGSSEIGSSSADENSDESTEEGSCSPEEFSENEETSRKATTDNRKPKVSSSKKTTQARRVKNSLTEDEVEELCDKLEIKREELDGKIKKRLDSSANLSFYPYRTALMAAVLADKVVLNEVTSEFVDDFILVIHDINGIY